MFGYRVMNTRYFLYAVLVKVGVWWLFVQRYIKREL